MENPMVIKCDVSDCAYNMDDCCHTMAITVGDSMNPKCDTFCHATLKGGNAAVIAYVGACKVSSCVFNSSLECESPGITIGYQGSEPDCLTFKSK